MYQQKVIILGIVLRLTLTKHTLSYFSSGGKLLESPLSYFAQWLKSSYLLEMFDLGCNLAIDSVTLFEMEFDIYRV